MKRIRSIKSDAFWTVDTKRRNPMPFPGRYPTRWRIRFNPLYTGKAEDLITKPNRIAMLWAYKLLKRNGIITLTEFDKGGAIRWCHRGCPRGNMGITALNNMLSRIYYPWSTTAENFFAPWHHPLYPLRVRFKKKVMGIVYTPYSDMVYTEAEKSGHTGLLREWKIWLRRELKSKPSISI